MLYQTVDHRYLENYRFSDRRHATAYQAPFGLVTKQDGIDQINGSPREIGIYDVFILTPIGSELSTQSSRCFGQFSAVYVHI